MTKIAIISTMGAFPWGGSEYLWAATANQALEEGHEVLLSIYDWSVNHPLVVQLKEKGAQIFPRPRFPKPGSIKSKVIKELKNIPLFKTFSPTSLFNSIFDCKPDIICVNQGWTHDIFYFPELLNLLVSSSIPYLIICHLNSDIIPINNEHRHSTKKLFEQATQVAFVSEQNLKLAERQVGHSIPNAIIVQNPVNLSERSLIDFPSSACINLASVARLETAYKGQDVLFESLSFPIWQQRNWQCRLYGSGDEKDYLIFLAEYYGIANKVKFMGHVNDVRSIWSDNHLLVLPSKAEGTPLALIEAMLCGRPAVVTDVGGNTEWIQEPLTGFVAQAPTAISVSSALERAWLAQENWQQMGIAAHEYAVARLDKSPSQKLLNMLVKYTANN